MTIPSHVLSLQRPHSSLWTLYIVRSIMSGPFALFLLPYLWFRYQTLRYRFEEDGVSMAWGILFRREIHLTYARIQDIHLRSGLLQRWLGLADIQVQTAAGSSDAELTIEGLREYEQVRDFLYERMRGLKDGAAEARAAAPARIAEGGDAAVALPGGDEVAALLAELVTEMRATREALEARARR